MPIRKVNATLYAGPEYEAFRELLRARAGDCCEMCGARNGTLDWGPEKTITIQCGVSHTDFDPRHRDPARARWLCRGCHLEHDRKNNIARRRRLRNNGRQLWLHEDLERADKDAERAVIPEGRVYVSVSAVSPERIKCDTSVANTPASPV